jgi:hypothetical protein
MGTKKTLWQRFIQLGLWGRLSAIGSIASIVSLVLAFYLTANPTCLLIISCSALLAVFGVAFFLYSAYRLDGLLGRLKTVPEDQRALLIRSEYKVVLPDTVTADQWIQSRRQAFLFWGFVLVVLAFSVILVVFFFIWKDAEVSHLRSENEAKQRDLTRLRSEMDSTQRKLDDAMVKDRARLVVVAEASGRASAVAHFQPSPETKLLASQLQQLVKDFELTIRPDSLSGEDDLRIRLAKASIALYEQKYVEALALVLNQAKTAWVFLGNNTKTWNPFAFPRV